MSLLVVLGVLGMLLTVGFTMHSALSVSVKGGQSLQDSLLEAWSNIAVGFGINYTANIFLLPLVGASVTLANNFWLGCIYTAISFLRQFVLRRFYNRRMLRGEEKA